MEYYTGVLQHPETHKQYYPITLWDLIVGKPTNFSDVYNSTINLYAGTQASHTSIGSFSVNSSSNVDIYFPVVSTQAMGLVPVLDSDTNHYLRGDGTWATPAGGGGGGYPSLTMPSAEFSVTGSGTSSITVSKQSQNVGTVWAAPANSNGAPSFRKLVVTDIPDLGNVSPKHYDAWMGQGISGSQTIRSMDAPFYCTDLRNPNVFPTLGNQWGYDSAAILPWHLTIWPKGNHSLTSSVSTSYQNWLACMMTSWAAGHPMSVSFVVSGRREWIPLIYTGPLKVSDGNGGYKVITVAIDLGAAIILTLLNYGYVPFTGTDLTSITSTFNSKMSIGMNPITFRWFSEYTNGCGNEDLEGDGKVMDFINGQIPPELQKEFSGFTAISLQDIENNVSYWHEHSGSGSIVENTTIGDGAVFKTWAEIAETTSTYKYGVLVCTALPNITGIQQSI